MNEHDKTKLAYSDKTTREGKFHQSASEPVVFINITSLLCILIVKKWVTVDYTICVS